MPLQAALSAFDRFGSTTPNLNSKYSDQRTFERASGRSLEWQRASGETALATFTNNVKSFEPSRSVRSKTCTVIRGPGQAGSSKGERLKTL